MTAPSRLPLIRLVIRLLLTASDPLGILNAVTVNAPEQVMSFIHVVYVGFFDSSSTYLDPRCVSRPLTRDELTAIEQDVAAAFNRVIELDQHVTPEGYLAFRCMGVYDWDDPYRVALVASRRLGTVAGERTILPAEYFRAAVEDIETRRAELKRIRGLPTGSDQVAAAVVHVKGGNPSFRLQWPYTLHAIQPGCRDTGRALARLLCDECAAVRAFAAAGLGLFGPASAPAVPALGAATTDPEKSVRRAAVDALRRIGPAAQPAILALLQAVKTDVDLGWEVTHVLKGMGATGVFALTELLSDRSGTVRTPAAERLAELGPAAVSASKALERVATQEKADRTLWRAARKAWRAINPGVPPPPETGPDWVKR